MIDAFAVKFDTVVFATDTADAGQRLAVWRQTAAACGFDPGNGFVKRIDDDRLDPGTRKLLEETRANDARVATAQARDRAIRALATQLPNGDLTEADELVRAIERASGPLPVSVADWLTHGRVRAEAT